MNERFFLLPAKRQEQILNAAYKSFASSSYDKASMSEIAGEARISKSLLFHYVTGSSFPIRSIRSGIVVIFLKCCAGV